MDQELFDELEQTYRSAGADALIGGLCQALRERKDYASLFYALLLQKRHELGVSPVPTAPTQDLPDAVHTAYEDAIRAAGRQVGQLYLDEGNLAQAWVYFRMLGEPGPVAQALDNYRPGENDDVQPIVQLAYYEGIHPRRGFDLILEKFGICSAITTMGGGETGHPPEVRDYCIKRLVRALYHELGDRLRGEIERREGQAPPKDTPMAQLIAGRDWLFEEEYSHVDMSHLSAVVQMSMHLTAGDELALARQLCAYGRRLPSKLQFPGDPPFENQYQDYGFYLAALAGEDVEAGIQHFSAKADAADPEMIGTFPAEVLVNLLLRLDRPAEALAVARQHLTAPNARPLSCPSIPELCRLAGDYAALASVARAQGDSVHFVAGLLAQQMENGATISR